MKKEICFENIEVNGEQSRVPVSARIWPIYDGIDKYVLAGNIEDEVDNEWPRIVVEIFLTFINQCNYTYYGLKRHERFDFLKFKFRAFFKVILADEKIEDDVIAGFNKEYISMVEDYNLSVETFVITASNVGIGQLKQLDCLSIANIDKKELLLYADMIATFLGETSYMELIFRSKDIKKKFIEIGKQVADKYGYSIKLNS